DVDARAQGDARDLARGRGHALRRSPSGGRSNAGLERPAVALPLRDAALDDVDHVVDPLALQEAGADRGALTRRADDGHRTLAIQAVGELAQVVVGAVQRARDVAGVVLGGLTDVEHLEAV